MNSDLIKKIGLSIVITVVLVVFVNVIGELTVRPRPELPYPQASETSEEPAKPAVATTQAAQNAPANPAGLVAAYDPAAGAKAFRKCKTCHTSKKGDKNRIGPNLWDVVGREKGSVEGFKYSDAMKLKGGVWSFEDLDRFLTRPRTFIRGTKMSIKGYGDPGARATLIGYLRALSDSPKALPQ
jgi:cytochrome c